MKKTVSIILLIAVICVFLCGCGSTKDEPVSETEPPASTTTETVEIVDDAFVIPDFKTAFTNGSMKIVERTNTRYYVRVTGCGHSEYESFVENCMSTDFPNVKSNMDYARGQHGFEAYTADGVYKIGAYLYTDENSNPTYIDIIYEYVIK